MEIFYRDFKTWLQNNSLNHNYNFKWWNIDTSFVSILNKFKNIKGETIEFVSFNGSDLKASKGKINIRDFIGVYSPSAVQQFFSVAIFFGVIKLNEDLKIKKKTTLLQKWMNNEIKLYINEDFVNSKDYIDYLFTNVKKIKEIFLTIEKNFKDTFIYDDMYKIIFDLYLFFSIEKRNLQENNFIVEKIIVVSTQRKSSSLTSWKSPYKSNRGLTYFNNYIFDDVVSDFKIQEADVNENKNMAIGYIGEYLFYLFSKHKHKFLNKINHPKVKEIRFLNYDWVSKRDKFSKYDFKIDHNYFEVKSTDRNSKKSSFIISDNELSHMENFINHSYVCLIKNINPDLVSFDDGAKDLKLISDLDFKFYDIFQLKDKFNIKSKGYWVTEK